MPSTNNIPNRITYKTRGDSAPKTIECLQWREALKEVERLKTKPHVVEIEAQQFINGIPFGATLYVRDTKGEWSATEMVA